MDLTENKINDLVHYDYHKIGNIDVECLFCNLFISLCQLNSKEETRF